LASPETRVRFYATQMGGPIIGVSSLLAVTFGSLALIRGSGGDNSSYDMAALGDGFFLFHGALGLGMLALLVGLAGHMPTQIRLRTLAGLKLEGSADSDDDERFDRLAHRDRFLGKISAGLIVGALIGMSMFRAFV